MTAKRANRPRNKNNNAKRHIVRARRKPQKRRKPMQRSSRQAVQVHPCTVQFAHALSDPFSMAALGACLPIEPVRTSQKVFKRTLINATIGTNGVCVCYVSPTFVNDRAFAWYSTSTYAATDGAFSVGAPGTTNVSTTTGISVAYLSNLPYSSFFFDVNKQASARIVAIGVKGYYTGTALNMAGLWHGFVQPDGGDVSMNALSALSSLPGYKTQPMSRKPTRLSCGPLDFEGYEWSRPGSLGLVSTGYASQTRTYPWTDTPLGVENSLAFTGENGVCPIVLAVTGGVAGQNVTFEICAHIEYTGAGITSQTISHTDEIAAKSLLATSSRMLATPTGWAPSPSALLSGLKSTVKNATQLIDIGKDVKSLYGEARSLFQGASRAVRPMRSVVTGIEEVFEAAAPLLMIA